MILEILKAGFLSLDISIFNGIIITLTYIFYEFIVIVFLYRINYPLRQLSQQVSRNNKFQREKRDSKKLVETIMKMDNVLIASSTKRV